MSYDTTLHIRLRDDTAERLQRATEQRIAREPWRTLTISDLAREAIQRGLFAIEAELSAEPASAPPASAPPERRGAARVTPTDGKGGRAGLDPKIRARIIREHRQGKAPAEIIRGLKADKVPTARGGEWRLSTLHGVLKAAGEL